MSSLKQQSRTILMLMLIPIVVSQQWNCLETLDWEPVDEVDYDRTYSPVTDIDARPLGFKVGGFVYDTNSGTCVTVQGTQRKRIEVVVETQPQATVCIRGGGVEKCAEADGSIYMCQEFVDENQASSSSTTFEFFCNDECHEADVNFWYRFTVSTADNSDDDEQWCWGRALDERPTHLVDLKFVVTTSVLLEVTSAAKSYLVSPGAALLIITGFLLRAAYNTY